MQDILAESLKRLKHNRVRRMRMLTILLLLSLVVSLDVFWVLRQPGLTLAGDADCRITEHTHDDLCQNGENPCQLIEHIHTIECYSDQTADAETQQDWQKMFAEYGCSDNLRANLAGIAKTQVGYTESAQNFEVGSDGVRRGYTRYGAWYGAPYNDWSAMFVSFCLHYAGADPEEFPGNLGVNAMAESWKRLGRYADAGEYDPEPGDLVFFADNTVGVVGEKLSSTIYVIMGDVENAVCADMLQITDPSIAGWGITSPITPEEEKPLDTEQTEETFPDLSDGPVFVITEGIANTESDKTQSQPMTYSIKSFRTMAIDTETKNIVDYLPGRGGNYYITLLDADHHELPKDADGNYVAEANTTYRLVISFGSPNGFEAGTYEYQFPPGMVINGGNNDDGIFELRDGTNVGSWTVTESGLISLTFNEDIEDRSEITISASMSVLFPETEEPIDFDGKIEVTVNKKEEEVLTTKVTKWGSQGILIVDPDNPDEQNNKNDPTKIYWTVRIDGNQNSNIPGSDLTDQIQQINPNISHKYTASDMENGIKFGASVKDENGVESTWHTWIVYPGDPNLKSWDENGWTYTIPETQECSICHNVYTLGNEGWTYYIEYTSTPNHTDIAGNMPYNNRVEVDNQVAEGVAKFSQGEVKVNVYKEGTLVADASGAKYIWEIQATIPGWKDPTKVDTNWLLNDEISISKMNSDAGYDWVAWMENSLQSATFTANYYGTTINVPNIADATEADPYAWRYAWGNNPELADGVTYSDNIYLLCQCHCPEGTHIDDKWHWAEGYGKDGTMYCNYWTEIEDTTFTVTYTTDNFEDIALYANHSNVLRNVSRLTANGEIPYRAETGANAPIPTMIEKAYVNSGNEEFPHYTITVNEAKLTLTDGSPLLIKDVMTHTLVYIKGSMVIMAEDADGNTWELRRDEDFTIDYYIDETQTENGRHRHVIDITILHPQPVKYILDYDTEIIGDPEDTVNGQLKYRNEATVTLWNKGFSHTTSEKTFAFLNISANAYKIELYKVAADTQLPLSGATFGLFNAKDVLITEAKTDQNGKLVFETNTPQGIVLREHQLYYVQELRAPPGYMLDKTKHWLCFCNDEGATCTEYKDVLAGVNAQRIPFGEKGNLRLQNEKIVYALPGTGGPGIYPVMLASVIFIITPLVYGFIRRRKRERRGVG